MTAARFGFEASSFFTAEGKSPGVGQLLIAMAPGPLSGGAFDDRLETLLKAVLEQEGTRLPGDRRLALRREARAKGAVISDQLYDHLAALGAFA